MHTPVSTYRLQANCNFTLHDIREIIDYLDKLGIDTLYCAPFFQSRCGSNHGYDVINPDIINPELGTIEDMRQIASILKSKNMNWLQDIVPNHMSYNHRNVWIRDIFEKGIHSDYYHFFDIDWNHRDSKVKGKVLLPFLGEPLDALIDQKKITVSFSGEGFSVNFYDVSYPLVWSSYYTILSASQSDRKNSDAWNTCMNIVNQLQNVSLHYSEVQASYEMLKLKEQLFQLYNVDQEVRTAIDHALQRINENGEALHQVLDQQLFLLVHYSHTDREINYRRFFVINDLICLRMESPKVFQHYHRFLKTLLEEDIIQGLRVDHVDGLADPQTYLKDLRGLAGEDCYIIVEKILEEKEKLPADWPIEGTSGYEFLSCISHLFTKSENEQKMTDIYHQFTGPIPDYEELVFEKKSNVLSNKMNGELDNLIELFLQIDASQQQSKTDLREALSILLASFHVYRTYANELPIKEEDNVVLIDAFEKAEARSPELSEQFQFMRSVLAEIDGSKKEEKLKLLVRVQQFTGPLAAKGVEDTVFYIYNRLISHNEVGDSPYRFGISVEEFHQAMKQRLQYLPLSINATATHDTKRGEDARMRINSLSEMPEAWAAMVGKWKSINLPHKQITEQGAIPSDQDEYYMYQSLLGSFPTDEIVDESFFQRFKDATMKALREAKVNSDWDHPNESYENYTFAFIDAILQNHEFIDSFLSFFTVVKHHGMILSLAQTLIKVTAPGIPDTFQGSELWDLNFVDPDNRRVIDFNLRKNILLDSVGRSEKDHAVYLKYLIDNAENGHIKLFTLWKSLQERRSKCSLFESGAYLPLSFSGLHSQQLIGFARHFEGQWSITIAPKEVKALGCCGSKFPLDETWGDTVAILPGHAPDEWTNIFTNEDYTTDHYTLEDKPSEESDAPIDASFSNELVIGKRLELKKVLKQFPIAMIKNK